MSSHKSKSKSPNRHAKKLSRDKFETEETFLKKRNTLQHDSAFHQRHDAAMDIEDSVGNNPKQRSQTLLQQSSDQR